MGSLVPIKILCSIIIFAVVPILIFIYKLLLLEKKYAIDCFFYALKSIIASKINVTPKGVKIMKFDRSNKFHLS